ncbi:hypothetical protein [Granulicella tundricola]|uniref:hypothetical protein n=1 Tax=Granulicella tundricola TaxID=940615 RepID=UPI0003102DE2|nr:hypothetical protein [Granulicella tundricola]
MAGLLADRDANTVAGSKDHQLRPDDRSPKSPPVAAWSQRELLVQQANRQRRYERWEKVRQLYLKTGGPDQELARKLGIDYRTVNP